jgi:hypothetical protein
VLGCLLPLCVLIKEKLKKTKQNKKTKNFELPQSTAREDSAV